MPYTRWPCVLSHGPSDPPQLCLSSLTTSSVQLGSKMKAAVVFLALAGLARSHVIEERDALNKRAMNLGVSFGSTVSVRPYT